jgi:ammonia channel protein AmtB
VKFDLFASFRSVHLINGVWGTLSVGLFAVPELLETLHNRSDHCGWFYSWSRGSADATLLACQIVGLLFVLCKFCFAVRRTNRLVIHTLTSVLFSVGNCDNVPIFLGVELSWLATVRGPSAEHHPLKFKPAIF